MIQLPINQKSTEDKHLPARMINEYTYCPRLYFYEHIDSVFRHNLETIEGSHNHRRVDEKTDELPPPEELLATDTPRTMRSITLSSEHYGIIAKMDLLEAQGKEVIPVDYKRGAPFKDDEGNLHAWDPDRVQVGAQAIILRENGYQCNEVVLYYAKTKQRVRLAVDSELLTQTISAIHAAKELEQTKKIPPPLLDSPKCPRCSLVSICLPDETNFCRSSKNLAHAEKDLNGNDTKGSSLTTQRYLFEIDPRQTLTTNRFSQQNKGELRRLVPARDDKKPLYLNTQGLSLGKSSQVLTVKEKGKIIEKVRMNDISQLNLFGNIQISTQAIQTLAQAEIPILYFTYGGWFCAATQGLGAKNIALRQEQFHWANNSKYFSLSFARELIAGKIRNQRTFLQRNHIDLPSVARLQLKRLYNQALQVQSQESLLGIEGNAAKIYFENFSGMIKTSEEAPHLSENEKSVGSAKADMSADKNDSSKNFTFDFTGRNRRPATDPVNALLSLAYSLLAKDLMIITHGVGLDPFQGFFHKPQFGRASLALDLMEPFRPLIADSAVLTAINNRQITAAHFVRANKAVALTQEGRKIFFHAYEKRMDTLVSHPLFGYRVSYRRILEIQTRLLARLLTGEISNYPPFTTR